MTTNPDTQGVVTFANLLYRELPAVPYMAKFVMFAQIQFFSRVLIFKGS